MGKNDVTEDSNIVDFENQISFVTLLCIFLIDTPSSCMRWLFYQKHWMI